MKQSVLTMVRQVLSETREKQASVAASSGLGKTAAAPAPVKERTEVYTTEVLNKLAGACDFLAEHLTEVVDQRTPREKLAEYVAISKLLQKQAFEVGNVAPPEPTSEVRHGDDAPKGDHQTKEAPGDSQPPVNPELNAGEPGVGGPDTAIEAEPAMTPGENPAEAGESGEGTGAHQAPKDPSTSEKPTPTSAPNALETNKEMMMPPQPENVLKQASKAKTAKRAVPPAFKAQQQKVVAAQDPGKPGAETPSGGTLKKAAALLKKAQAAHVPSHIARAMVSMVTKTAEDALYPAQISAGTEPSLQKAQGAPSQLSQGLEAGEGTPRECAPNEGEGAGRELLSSNESAINATKVQAKGQNKGAINQVLTEPPMSEAHDQVLQQSLDNTSSAGVKISAARELLRKFAAQSRENELLLRELLKTGAEGPVAVPPAGAASSEMEPGLSGEGEEGLPMEAGAEPDVEGLLAGEMPSDEALEAASSGVTPEELLQAHALLAAQGEEVAQAAETQMPAEEEVAAAEAPPAAPTGEAGTKASQMGMSQQSPGWSPTSQQAY